ncbi:hypothetical protein VPH35_030520 [Triticum aestivum]
MNECFVSSSLKEVNYDFTNSWRYLLILNSQSFIRFNTMIVALTMPNCIGSIILFDCLALQNCCTEQIYRWYKLFLLLTMYIWNNDHTYYLELYSLHIYAYIF